MRLSLIALTFIFSLSGSFTSFSQDFPSDFLSSEFHKSRRDSLRSLMPENSVAVFFSNPVRNRANDVDYIYHQDPDFRYFTGYREPHSVLLIFKEEQETPNGNKYNEIIFVQPRNEYAEMWTGRRLGSAGVKEQLGLQNAFENSEFASYNVDFASFDKIYFDEFYDDVRDTRSESDLYDIIKMFKQKVGYSEEGEDLNPEPQPVNIDHAGLDAMMAQLRGIKTKEELELIRKAVNISAIGQNEVMKAMKPGMSEREIQGIHEFVFKKYGSEYEGYPSIVGAGHNGCILHYIDNYKPEVDSEELILMDLGAEYHGYTADVTRTIPVSGKFSKEQKLIYDLVYKAQDEAIKMVKPGGTFSALSEKTREIINEGLAELGIIDSVDQKHRYYPHGCCHHIGLDVHDIGEYDMLRENMTFTVEPGIYIPEGSDCDEKWWKIAVRIEDDILVTRDGYEILSGKSPRKSDEIEEMMKQPSPLDSFVLPDLD